MAAPAIYKKNAEITPLQERLLNFFENDDCDLPVRITALEWIFDEVLYGSKTPLEGSHRGHLFELSELIKIIKGIGQGY